MIEKGVNTEKIPEIIGGWWKDWKAARQTKENIWDECIKHYMVYIDEAKFDGWPWRCKISRPMTQEVVDSIASAIKNALFPINEEFFEVEGLDEVGRKFAREMENYLKKVLYAMRFTSRFDPFTKQMCVIGNSTGGLYWHSTSGNKSKWVMTPLGPKEVSYKKILSDYPVFETHDMFEVVYDPMAREYNSGTVRIRRKLTTIDELKRKKDLYSNLAELDVSADGNSAPVDPSDAGRETRRSIFGINEGVLSKKGRVELLIATGDIVLDGKMYKDHLAVVANRKVLIRFEKSIYWCGNPHTFSSYASTLTGEPLGRGPAEPIRGNQKLLDTLSCQKADMASLVMGGFWAVGRDSMADFENVIAQPFSTIMLDDVNNIKSLVPSINPTLAFAEINDLREESERSSGASNAVQGVASSGRRTATEVMQIGAGSSARFNDITTHVGEMAVEPLLNMILEQEKQFNFYNPASAQIMDMRAWDGEYIVKFNGAKNTALRELAMQMFLQFQGFLGSNPIFSQFINPPEMIKESFKIFGITNEKIVRQEPLVNEFPQLGAGKGSGESAESEIEVPPTMRNIGNV